MEKTFSARRGNRPRKCDPKRLLTIADENLPCAEAVEVSRHPNVEAAHVRTEGHIGIFWPHGSSSLASPDIDRGNSDFDVRHAFTAGVTYKLPSPKWNNDIARGALGGWSVDSFIFARTAPPVDVFSGLIVAEGIDLYPRPDVVPGVPLVLYGSEYPGGKAFNPAAFTVALRGNKAISGAMCSAVSKRRKRILGCSANFALPKRWSCVFGPNSSTFSTIRTLPIRTTS